MWRFSSRWQAKQLQAGNEMSDELAKANKRLVKMTRGHAELMRESMDHATKCNFIAGADDPQAFRAFGTAAGLNWQNLDAAKKSTAEKLAQVNRTVSMEFQKRDPKIAEYLREEMMMQEEFAGRAEHIEDEKKLSALHKEADLAEKRLRKKWKPQVALVGKMRGRVEFLRAQIMAEVVHVLLVTQPFSRIPMGLPRGNWPVILPMLEDVPPEFSEFAWKDDGRVLGADAAQKALDAKGLQE